MVSVADFFSCSATVGAEVNQKLIGHYRTATSPISWHARWNHKMALTMPAMVRTSYPYRGNDRIILRGNYCFRYGSSDTNLCDKQQTGIKPMEKFPSSICWSASLRTQLLISGDRCRKPMENFPSSTNRPAPLQTQILRSGASVRKAMENFPSSTS